MKKNAKMLAIEERLGEKLEVLVPKVLNQMDISQAAQHLGITPTTLYTWIGRLSLQQVWVAPPGPFAAAVSLIDSDESD